MEGHGPTSDGEAPASYFQKFPHDVFRATILAKLTYCVPAWLGGCSAADRR